MRMRMRNIPHFAHPNAQRPSTHILNTGKVMVSELRRCSIIREEFDINDEIHAASPRHLSYFMFKILVQILRKKSGIIEKPPMRTQHQVMESHGFRKFFQTEAVKVE
jgi:hypothetical protein